MKRRGFGGKGAARRHVGQRPAPEAIVITIANSTTTTRNYDILNSIGSISPTETTVSADSDITTSEGTIAQFRSRLQSQPIQFKGIHYRVQNTLNFAQAFTYYIRDVDGTQKRKPLAPLIEVAQTANRYVAEILKLDFAGWLTPDSTLVVGVRGSETVNIGFFLVPGGVQRYV